MTSKQVFLPIGTKVTYIRQNSLEAPETGSGTILGYALDPNKRQLAHLETHTDNKEKINVDVACLNPSGEYIEKYADAIKDIKELSEEGNGKVAEIVAKYNKAVDEVFETFLSEPVVLED